MADFLKTNRWTSCYDLEEVTGLKYLGGALHEAMEADPEVEFKHWCGGTSYRRKK